MGSRFWELSYLFVLIAISCTWVHYFPIVHNICRGSWNVLNPFTSPISCCGPVLKAVDSAAKGS